ncbi:MAG: hypothetical protein SGI74_13285 [Oligoflexia bacterium]|nr:hypothetical protein [Oligoflexia bacterium]
MQSISKLISSFLILIVITGCVTNPKNDPPIKEPESRIYGDAYEQVWRSMQLALRKYPVKINNIDLGVLETDYVRGDKVFTDPNDTRPKPGYRYKITVRVVRGRVEGKAAVEVIVLKSAEIQPDFFSGFQAVSSNGLEEISILYRIGRYLEIDRILTRNAAKN